MFEKDKKINNTPLEKFQNEIQAMKEVDNDPHFFPEINPDYLGEFEKKAYEMYKEKGLTNEEFVELRNAVKKYNLSLDINENSPQFKSINLFWAYLCNRVISDNALQQIEEFRKEKNLD